MIVTGEALACYFRGNQAGRIGKKNIPFLVPSIANFNSLKRTFASIFLPANPPHLR
jgi:hypothetical protein